MTLIAHGGRNEARPTIDQLDAAPVGSHVVFSYALEPSRGAGRYERTRDGWREIGDLINGRRQPPRSSSNEIQSVTLVNCWGDPASADLVSWWLHHPGLILVHQIHDDVLGWFSAWECRVCGDGLGYFDSPSLARDHAGPHLANHVEIARAL